MYDSDKNIIRIIEDYSWSTVHDSEAWSELEVAMLL